MRLKARPFVVLGLCLLILLPVIVLANDEGSEGQRIVIRNNNLADSGFGIYIGPRDDEFLITGNTITKNAEGIRLTGIKAGNFIRNNRILDNLAGITLRDEYADNEEGFVKYPVDPKDIHISENEFSGNDDGNILNMLKGDDPDKEEAEEEASDSSQQEASGSDSPDNDGSSSETETEDSKTEEASESTDSPDQNENAGGSEPKDASSAEEENDTDENASESSEELASSDSDSNNHANTNDSEESTETDINEDTHGSGSGSSEANVAFWARPLVLAGAAVASFVLVLAL